jgi:hypothetical protein
MDQPLLENGSKALERLGEPKLVCRTSKAALFWGFLAACVLGGCGTAPLVVVLRRLVSDWSSDVLGSLLFVGAGVFLLWGARALWRSTNRLRYTRAIVHADGVSYRKGDTCLTCRWDEIDEIRCRVTDYYERTAAVGLIPIPRGATTPKFVHRSLSLTVRRKDGLELVFTEELKNVAAFISAIEREAGRRHLRWAEEQRGSTAAVTKRG